jgi:chloramphenicol 3-O-phosphotransferase
VKLLHQAGASLTEVDDAGYYPISVLFQNQDLEESLQILKYLLENGANVHVKDYETEDSLLHNCGGIFSIFGYFFVGVFEPWDSQFFFYSHQYF